MMKKKRKRGQDEKFIHCQHCQKDFPVLTETLQENIGFCVFCGYPLRQKDKENIAISSFSLISSSEKNSLLPGMEPQKDQISFSLGPYKILKKIGQGGMGEIFLAFDPTCGRRIALKKIRSDLKDHPHLYHRFFKEARITSQLTHPSVIPIYTIHWENDSLYYSMPYVEGETLKQILRATKQQEKKGETLHPIGGSILALIRIFVNICHAVSYAHSHGVLHRDLKPENIIIGKFGEVFILDWGLAKLLEDKEEDIVVKSEPSPSLEDELTSRGKVVGTISYMSPERALGFPATVQSDIYALGVILYQLLCLRLPFKREDLKDFKKKMHKEVFFDPAEVAPYRDVPEMLSKITKKCLSPSMEERYDSVDLLLKDVENYIQGGSEWFFVKELSHKKKNDWEFQENVLIAENLAITRNAEEADWFSLMISKASFTGNTKLETEVDLEETSQGIGFLLCVPEPAERVHVHDGYCLWLSSSNFRSTKLLCSTVEVVYAPDIFLVPKKRYKIRIEKIEQHISLYINDALQFSYVNLMPMMGTHVGILSRDTHHHLSPLSIYVSTLSVTVNCLAIPDAFLAHKDYESALSEYRRIGYSFPGRMEGREAIFRAGYTLVEKASFRKNTEHFLDEALKEFERLHGTPGAPLEYLGKSLVYQKLGDDVEEGKCYELALRRYPHHPLLPILHQYLLFRLHQSSRKERKATYQFALLVTRLLPKETIGQNTRKLFTSIQKNWEILNFILPLKNEESEYLHHFQFSLLLAFWTAKPYFLKEIFLEFLRSKSTCLTIPYNILSSLLELGDEESFLEMIETLLEDSNEHFPSLFFKEIQIVQNIFHIGKDTIKRVELCLPHLSFPLIKKAFFTLLFQATDEGKSKDVLFLLEKISFAPFSEEEIFALKEIELFQLIFENKWEKLNTLFLQYPPELLQQESSLLHFLYGCFLQAIKGKDVSFVHFSSILHVSYPRSWTLLSHYLTDSIHEETGWFKNAFLWEKKQLYRQLSLYYHVLGDKEKKKRYQMFALQEKA